MHGLSEPKPAVPDHEVRTEEKRSPSRSVLLPAMSSLGLPMFVFGVVFFSVTLLITLFVTPDRFPVRMGEQVLRIRDLENEQQRLETRKADLTALRSTLTADIRAPVLHQVGRLKEGMFPVGKTLLSIEQVRLSFASSDADPISFPGIEVRGIEGKIFLSGEVRDPDGRSIQLLASFVDGLRSLPTVQSVTEPEYVQTSGPDGLSVSPFSLTIVLRHG